jgi:hypothetical protein
MSYTKAGSSNVTMIEDLIDLDETNPSLSSNNILPNGQEDKYSKFIRQKHIPKYSEYQNNQEQIIPHNQQQFMNNNQEQIIPYNQQQFMNNNQEQIIPHNQQQFMNNIPLEYHQPLYNIPMHSPYSCLDIAAHIDNCPICSKFYKNDKTVFIVSIVLLTIVCIILLKKVLEK